MRDWLIAGGLLIVLFALTARTPRHVQSEPAPVAPPRIQPVTAPDPLTLELMRLEHDAKRYRAKVPGR